MAAPGPPLPILAKVRDRSLPPSQLAPQHTLFPLPSHTESSGVVQLWPKALCCAPAPVTLLVHRKEM